MRIAFNPSTVAALITPPNNKDITFDLRGRNIFARGVKFCGTDTNTWRDIKINNVSIGSNTLDLRNGSNTTLTNTNGVVTINSTWRPVVDNLTSDSTTSSLSAKQGIVLKALIDGKSDSEHNHDDRYLKLIGGTMLLGEGLKFHADNNYFGTNEDARIISLLDRNDKICDGGLIIDERATLNGTEYVTELLRIRDSEFKWKGSNILHSGNTYVSNNKGYINGTEITQVNNASNATNSINSNRLSSNAEFALGNNFLQYFNTAGLGSSGVNNAAPDKDWWHIIRMNHPSSKGHFSELAIALNSYNGVYWRTINAGREARSWTRLANIEDLAWNNITGKPSSFNPSSHTHTWTSITDKLVAGNEFNIVNAGFNAELWFNYLPINDRSKSATISAYCFGNGNKGVTAVRASGFIKNGSSSSYVLLGDGGHQTISSLSVNYANSAGNADTVDGEHASSFVRAGTYESQDLNKLDTYSFIKSVDSNNKDTSPKGNTGWYNVIQAVHRNGNGDGPGYIGQIALGMTINTGDMFFRGRRTDSWKTVIHSGNISSQTVANAYHLRINSANTWSTWYWSGQSGQPSWLWGSNDGTNMYVWNPSNFRVAYASSAGNADTVDGEHASAFTRIVGRHEIYTSGTAPYKYIYLFRIANSTVYSTLDCEIDFRTRYHSAKIEIRISTFNPPYGNGKSSISIVKKVVSGRTCNLWVLPTVQSSNYNYYDVYYESGAWNSGSYGITLKGSNGNLVFEHKGTNLTSLPDKVTPVSNNSATSATKLATARTIWGQSFDGTGNVNGTIYINNSDSSNGAIRLNNNVNSNARISAIKDQVIFNTGSAIRFGGTSWDWNQWAGLKYTHSNKTIYLGIADGSVFNSNSTQSGGILNLRAGISNIHLNSGTSIIGLATNGSPYSSRVTLNDTSISLSAYGDISMSTEPGAIELTSEYSGIKLSCQGNNASIDSGGFKVEASKGVYLNSGNSGNVGIGTGTPSYKLDVNGQMRASGFHHGSVNSDNYMLLAGGGYKSFGGDDSNPIFLGYLDLNHGNDGTISSSFYCLGYSVPFTYTRGGNYCRISIPDTTHQTFYIHAAIASVNYSGGGMDTWVGEHRGTGAWWLHCYAYGLNEVRVKGFRQYDHHSDSWWGGNPLWSSNEGANRITVCIFGHVKFQ